MDREAATGACVPRAGRGRGGRLHGRGQDDRGPQRSPHATGGPGGRRRRGDRAPRGQARSSGIFATDGEAVVSCARRSGSRSSCSTSPGRDRVLALGGGALHVGQSVREALARPSRRLDRRRRLRPRGRRCERSGRPLARDRDRVRAPSTHGARARLRLSAADVIVPAFSERRLDGRVLDADRGPSRGNVKMLWATSESAATTPPTSAPGLLGAPLLAADGSPGAASWSPTAPPGGSTANGCSRLDGRVAIMPGEQSKTIAHAEIVWSELARERDDPRRRRRRARRRRGR